MGDELGTRALNTSSSGQELERDRGSRFYQKSWLLARFEKVFLVEMPSPALRPRLVVVEFDDGVNPRAIGTHIHVIFSPGWVSKQFFLQRWFNDPFLQFAIRHSHLSLNGRWATSSYSQSTKENLSMLKLLIKSRFRSTSGGAVAWLNPSTMQVTSSSQA